MQRAVRAAPGRLSGAALILVVALMLVARRVVDGELPGQQRLFEAGGMPGPQAPSVDGIPTISDTYNPRDQGTDWPPDAFTSMVVGHESPRSIASPAMHSYDGDGNMEGLTVLGPHSRQEDRTDLANYTGAVGPAGGSTPESHPELTAP